MNGRQFGVIVTLLFVVMTAASLILPLGINVKVLVIGWFAFAAMMGGTLLGVFADSRSKENYARNIVWGYGLASGAMITSSTVFLIPPALGLDKAMGGFGIALGLITGFTTHTVSHSSRTSFLKFDHTVVNITAHTVAAGAIIGVIYEGLPGLGLVLGLAIVSHKGPGGYSIARRLKRLEDKKDVLVLLTPSSSVGVMAILTNYFGIPAIPSLHGLVFGFSAGIFLHVALDFLPRCQHGSEIYEIVESETDESDELHTHSEILDKLRVHSVVSTLLGLGVIAAAWWLV